MTEFSTGVLVWWAGISAVALLNLCLWAFSAKVVLGTTHATAEIGRYRRIQLLLSAGYVVGCASRSFILRSDVARFSMFDHFVTSAFVGRSVATVAEMLFVAQWAVLLHALSRRSGSARGRALAWSLVPIIAVAETCSWYGILTTNSLGNAIEESLWTLTAALFMVGLFLQRRSADATLRRFLHATLVVCACYLAYMITLDVPMYIGKWQAAEAAGRVYFGFAEGVQDAMRWTVTGRWEDWKNEILWQSLYFSFAVWGSLILIHRPRFPEEQSQAGVQ